MSFFVDDFFDELDKGSLDEAKLLAEKWDEIFLRKELRKNLEVLEDAESSGKDTSKTETISESKDESSEKETDSESRENSSQEDIAENSEADNESGDMSDDDLKVAVAATMLKKSVFGLLDWFHGKFSETFKSGDAIIAVSGTEEDNIEFCYERGNAELDFYFNGDDLGIDEMDDVDDEYDTGIYIFQKLYMALKINGKTEIEFLRIRKKNRHAIRENDITLTEFLEKFTPYYGFTDFPESFAEHVMQLFIELAYVYGQKKADVNKAEQEKVNAELEKENEAELHRKEDLLKDI